jgi:multidrug efflux pump
MRFTDAFIRRPTLSIVVSLLILLIGASALFGLPVREYPYMESATIQIDTAYPGATQDVMQGFVTTPIVQAIASASGIEYITSTSSQGTSQIKAKLVLNADSDRAMTEVLAKVSQVKYRLPIGAADPVITKVTDAESAIEYVAFVSDTYPVPQLTDFITRVAQPLIIAVPGVATAAIQGGQTLAMRIWASPDKLAARGLTGADLVDVLRANNVQAAPGQLKGAQTAINITAATDLRSADDFRQIVIKRDEHGIVRLGDVATVEIGGENYDSSGTASGHRAVTLAVSPTPDGNPLEIVKAVKALLPRIQRAAPPDVEVFNDYDVAHFVNSSIEEVIRSLVAAVAIVMLVIFLSLGSVRAVLIPVMTIPLSLVGTAALMLLFGFSLNLLTLLAMVLAIGLVVDDAIVVVENIHRHIEEGLTPLNAALMGAREIISPVIAMTITLAAVYTPIGLMGGLTGSLFREFAFTLAASVIVSGVIALTLSPMMSSRLLRPKSSEGWLTRAIEQNMARLTAVYGRVLGGALAARGAVLLAGAVILATIVLFFTGAERELAPQEDQGVVIVNTKAPRYANVSYVARASDEVEKLFESLPEFETSWFNNSPTSAFGGVVLENWSKRDRGADAVQAQLTRQGADIPSVYVTVFQKASLPAGSSGLPVQMVVRSADDFPVLYAAMERLKGAARGSGLFSFVDSDLAFDSPEAHVAVDRGKAGDLGVPMAAIANVLATLVGENYISRFNWHNRSYDVIVQAPRDRRLTPDNLGQFYVRASSGDLVPLSTVVHINMRPQPNVLPQFNQLNSATLSAVLAPGVTMGQAVGFLQAQELPSGMSIDWLSNSRQFVTEGNRLTGSFLFALVVIFLVLTAQFESFRDPLVILVSVPLAVCGALTPLYLGFTTLNIYTQIGLVTLIGLISKHGILMVSFANQIQRTEALDRMAAIRRAAAVRMRPILMTTAAMVAGLIPLVFARGAGAQSRFAIGIVVVMGMLVGTLFTLFVLPTIYSLIAGDHRESATTEGMESERQNSAAVTEHGRSPARELGYF